MRKLFFALVTVLLPLAAAQAAPLWEKQGDFYFLSKDGRENFSAASAGANKFAGKYLRYDGIDFWARAAEGRQDYGRLDLEGNKIFALPIRPGMKVQELHLLAGGNVGNRYEHDSLLQLYGDNYYYSTLTVTFCYQDDTYRELSVPVFWDWFHLGPGAWSQDGAAIRSAGNNPVRKDATLFHVSFVNPRPGEALKAVLVSDSWLGDRPFSEVFSVTLKSPDPMEALPKQDREYKITAAGADQLPPDTRKNWSFDKDLDGWTAGGSANWGLEANWQPEVYGRKGAVFLPACAVGGDKFSWIEKKIALPEADKLELRFSRRSAQYSQTEKRWTDGLLRVVVKSPAGQGTVYEKIYSGEWNAETADLSRYQGKTVIIRFESRGAGAVRLAPTTSPLCDGEDAVIAEVSLSPNG